MSKKPKFPPFPPNSEFTVWPGTPPKSPPSEWIPKKDTKVGWWARFTGRSEIDGLRKRIGELEAHNTELLDGGAPILKRIIEFESIVRALRKTVATAVWGSKRQKTLLKKHTRWSRIWKDLQQKEKEAKDE